LTGVIECGDAVAQMRDDRIEPHALRLLLAAHARQFDRTLKRFFDGAERVEKHAMQPGLLCEIARHARADNDLAALGRERVDGHADFVD
jgi:hypothetical protein